MSAASGSAVLDLDWTRAQAIPYDHLQRLLLVCPHPDDETLGAGILLQNAVAYGATIQVLYLTNGERNPLPQFAAERRWPWRRDDCARWGARRRAEAARALRILGVESVPEFWELPDQGLAALSDGEALVERMRSVIDAFAPTLVVTPSRRDLHADHAAAVTVVERALRICRRDGTPHLTYVVHGSPVPLARALAPRHSPDLRERKRQALQCHTTQLLLSRRRLSALAARDELYMLAEADGEAAPARWRGLLRLLHLFR
ncbi:MAG: putative LmbE-like protein [Acidobacteria bacterium]|nr:putative LmbE-like protein [Acidobacteriota bacterium]